MTEPDKTPQPEAFQHPTDPDRIVLVNAPQTRDQKLERLGKDLEMALNEFHRCVSAVGGGALNVPESELNPPQSFRAMLQADMSTSHLSEAEAQTPAKDWPIWCFEASDAFMVLVDEALSGAAFPDETETEEGYPLVQKWPGLYAVCKWAKRYGIRWVRFDCDSDVQPGLPTWEW